MDELQQQVYNALEPVREVYSTLLQNAVLRTRLGKAGLTDSEWREIESLAIKGPDQPAYELDIYALYSWISTMLAFARALATKVKPALKQELSRTRPQATDSGRIALEMTASNLDSNISVLVDRLSDLYIAVSRLDENRHGSEKALRASFHDLADSKTWQVGAGS